MCNFPLPCLANFVKKLVLCFVPKLPRINISYKIFCKKLFLCVLRKASGLIKRCWKSSNPNRDTYIKLTAATPAPLWCCQKIYFNIKVEKISFELKRMFFFFSHFNNFFVTHGHIPSVLNFLDLILSELSHNQSPQHSKTYIQSLKAKTEIDFISWQS